MRGIDVARVVFLIRHQFDPVLFVWNHVAEAVALRVLGQGGCVEDAVDPLLGNLLVLGEDPLLFQLQLQGLALGKSNRGTLVTEFQRTQRFLFRSPESFYSFTFQHTKETIQARNLILINVHVSQPSSSPTVEF